MKKIILLIFLIIGIHGCKKYNFQKSYEYKDSLNIDNNFNDEKILNIEYPELKDEPVMEDFLEMEVEPIMEDVSSMGVSPSMEVDPVMENPILIYETNNFGDINYVLIDTMIVGYMNYTQTKDLCVSRTYKFLLFQRFTDYAFKFPKGTSRSYLISTFVIGSPYRSVLKTDNVFRNNCTALFKG